MEIRGCREGCRQGVMEGGMQTGSQVWGEGDAGSRVWRERIPGGRYGEKGVSGGIKGRRYGEQRRQEVCMEGGMHTESQRLRKYECKQGEMERGMDTWSQGWGGMMAGMEGWKHGISSICLA